MTEKEIKDLEEQFNGVHSNLNLQNTSIVTLYKRIAYMQDVEIQKLREEICELGNKLYDLESNKDVNDR